SERETAVRDRQRGSGAVELDARPIEGVDKEPDRGEADQEHEGRGGQESPNATGVEAREIDAAAGVELAKQQSGDQVPGDDKEDVHADKAACRNDAGVKQDDEEDRQPAEALDVGSETTIGVGHAPETSMGCD